MIGTHKNARLREHLYFGYVPGTRLHSAGRRFAGRRIASSPAESRTGGFLHSAKIKMPACAGTCILAEWTGLEPATPGVTGRYSNQLNYHSNTLICASSLSGGC